MKAIYAILQEINGQYHYVSTNEVNDIPSEIINEYNKYINNYRTKPLPNVVKLNDYVFIESEYDKKNKVIKGYYISNEQFVLLSIDELISKSNNILTHLFKRYGNPTNETQMEYYFNIIKKIIMTNHISFITKEYPSKRKEVLIDPIEMWVENEESPIFMEYYENDVDFDNFDNFNNFERNKAKIVEILNSDVFNKVKINKIFDLLKINETHRKKILEKGKNGNRMKVIRFLKKIEKYIGKV